MADQGDGAGPSAAAGGLTPAAEPERSDPEPQAPARERWLKSLSAYDRRHSSEIHGSRYG